jgi:hypothetical protein
MQASAKKFFRVPGSAKQTYMPRNGSWHMGKSRRYHLHQQLCRNGRWRMGIWLSLLSLFCFLASQWPVFDFAGKLF